MRIAPVAHSYPRFPGDSNGTFVERICQELAKLGHAVDVLVPDDVELARDGRAPLTVSSFRYLAPRSAQRLGYSRTLERDTGIKATAALAAPLYFLCGSRALARHVRRRRSEVVHAHWILPNGFLAAVAKRRTGVPYVAMLHGSDVFMAERNALMRWMARVALAGATYVTSCSPDLRDRLLAVGGGEHAGKIHLVPYGADLSAPPTAAEVAAARSRLGLAAGDRPVVAVGRLVDKKGFDVLVAALPALLAREPAAKLVIGGGGPLAEPLAAQARALGVAERVVFAGALAHPQVLALMALGEVFVMPSVRDAEGNIDGLPVVIPEAMAAARPVVASNLAGIPLAITDGETGLLVAERDPAALAGALARVLADPALAARLGRAAGERVARELTWQAIARVHDRLQSAAFRR
ncbi:MAG TPA: glycosyltransferase [Thermoanaerobaculia bacterium]|jgi:glycosyltransferase involved in cell wall biosynthesis